MNKSRGRNIMHPKSRQKKNKTIMKVGGKGGGGRKVSYFFHKKENNILYIVKFYSREYIS